MSSQNSGAVQLLHSYLHLVFAYAKSGFLMAQPQGRSSYIYDGNSFAKFNRLVLMSLFNFFSNMNKHEINMIQVVLINDLLEIYL